MARHTNMAKHYRAAAVCGNCGLAGGLHMPGCTSPYALAAHEAPSTDGASPVTYPRLAARSTEGPRGAVCSRAMSNDNRTDWPSRPEPSPDPGVELERVIAERVEEGWLVSWPDGTATAYRTQRAALGAVLEYGKRNYPRAPRNREGDIRIGLLEGDIRIVEIEWRA